MEEFHEERCFVCQSADECPCEEDVWGDSW